MNGTTKAVLAFGVFNAVMFLALSAYIWFYIATDRAKQREAEGVASVEQVRRVMDFKAQID